MVSDYTVDTGMGIRDDEPPEKIEEWYKNYAVGCPAFASDVKDELLALRTEERSLRDVYCLAAALTINSRDLVHDITQSIMDYHLALNAERDAIIQLTHQAVKDFTVGDLQLVKKEDGFMSGDIRQAVAIAMNVKLDTDHVDIKRIRELVALVRRVHILI
jgi:hypothetical protein|tara:strand:+ start:20343 stop:20822 length:480 start_codon:yes stop_codon:yes gene_type:complete